MPSLLKVQGISELTNAIQNHQVYLQESGLLAQRAQRLVQSEIQNLILQTVLNALKDAVSEEDWRTFVEDVTKRARDPYSITAELAARVGLKQA